MQKGISIKKYNVTTFQIAVATIFAALVATVTLVTALLPTANGGYLNFGDTIIYSAALLGPFVGLIAGAGASIADIVVSPYYAPITLIIKAIEGLLVGYLIKKLDKKIKNLTLCASIAILIGGSEMVTGYFIYETFMFGYSVALTGVPLNIIQMLSGLIIAVPIIHAMLRIFPQIRNYL
jgi:uncharacterized membrane protein